MLISFHFSYSESVFVVIFLFFYFVLAPGASARKEGQKTNVTPTLHERFV